MSWMFRLTIFLHLTRMPLPSVAVIAIQLHHGLFGVRVGPGDERVVVSASAQNAFQRYRCFL